VILAHFWSVVVAENLAMCTSHEAKSVDLQDQDSGVPRPIQCKLSLETSSEASTTPTLQASKQLKLILLQELLPRNKSSERQQQTLQAQYSIFTY